MVRGRATVPSRFRLQMKIREEREARRASMDGRHEYVLSTVAERLDMTMEDAEEFMLDGDQVRMRWRLM